MISEIPALTLPRHADVGGNALNAAGEAPRVSELPGADPLGFGTLLDALNAGGATLAKADAAENAFAAGTGDLQEMVFERAKADSIVSLAAAVSSRVAQSLNTFVQMQL